MATLTINRHKALGVGAGGAGGASWRVFDGVRDTNCATYVPSARKAAAAGERASTCRNPPDEHADGPACRVRGLPDAPLGRDSQLVRRAAAADQHQRPGAAICAISGSSRRRRAPPSTAPTTWAEPGGAQLVGLAGAVGPAGDPAKSRGPSRAQDAAHLPSVDQARPQRPQPHEAKPADLGAHRCGRADGRPAQGEHRFGVNMVRGHAPHVVGPSTAAGIAVLRLPPRGWARCSAAAS